VTSSSVGKNTSFGVTVILGFFQVMPMYSAYALYAFASAFL